MNGALVDKGRVGWMMLTFEQYARSLETITEYMYDSFRNLKLRSTTNCFSRLFKIIHQIPDTPTSPIQRTHPFLLPAIIYGRQHYSDFNLQSSTSHSLLFVRCRPEGSICLKPDSIDTDKPSRICWVIIKVITPTFNIHTCQVWLIECIR